MKLKHIREDVSTGRLGYIHNYKGGAEIEELCRTERGTCKVRIYNIQSKSVYNSKDEIVKSFSVSSKDIGGGFYIGWVNESHVEWLDNWKALNRAKKLEKLEE